MLRLLERELTSLNDTKQKPQQNFLFRLSLIYILIYIIMILINELMSNN
jgi:hypothetical protein